jgi:membrane-bound metal-dependent hydrolase YbcI (DUF457 family)
VILWFAGLAFVIVWSVFRDTAIDYRIVVAGALLPDVLDAPFGGPRVAHTLVASVALLVVVMLATRGHRSWRRRWLALPIGTFCHLLLDGVWTRTALLWWPFLGDGLHDRGLPSIGRPLAVVVAMECAGAIALAWVVARFRLRERERLHQFAATGRLGRDLREVAR